MKNILGSANSRCGGSVMGVMQEIARGSVRSGREMRERSRCEGQRFPEAGLMPKANF